MVLLFFFISVLLPDFSDILALPVNDSDADAVLRGYQPVRQVQSLAFQQLLLGQSRFLFAHSLYSTMYQSSASMSA